MGGGHSGTNSQQTITEVVVDLLVKTMQSSVALVDYQQNIQLDCGLFNTLVAKYDKACFERWSARPSEEIKVLCADVTDFKCEASNITLNQVVSADISSAQEQKLRINISSEVTSKLSTKLQQESGLLQFSNKTKIDVKSLTQLTTTVFCDGIQSIYANMSGKQKIQAGGASITFVTMTQARTSVSQFLQKSYQYIDAATTVAQDISADLSEQNKVLYTVWSIAISVISVFLCFVLLIVLLRAVRLRRVRKIVS